MMAARVNVLSPSVLHQLLAHEQALRQSLPAKLQALRLQRQWGALRAERSLTHLLLALIRIQIQLVQAHASPTSAPARFKSDGGHATWVATLEHQQLGLRLRAGAAARQRDSELQCAAALRKRAERRRQLAAVLRRCVPVYQAGPSRLHAPVEMDQAAFERVVCSKHAREARLIWRWVAHFVTRERAAAPSSGAVVDFVAYVGRLIAAEYGFGAEALPPPLQPRPQPGPPHPGPGPHPKLKPIQELPPLQLFAARLLLPMLQQQLFALDLQADTHCGMWHDVPGACACGVWHVHVACGMCMCMWLMCKHDVHAHTSRTAPRPRQ